MPVVSERLQDAALGGDAVAASGFRQARQLVPQGRKPPKFGLDLGELRDGQGVGITAGAFRVDGQVQQLPDGLEAETELARMPDEGQPLPVRAAYMRCPPSVLAALGNSPIFSYQRRVCTLQPASQASWPMGISGP